VAKSKHDRVAERLARKDNTDYNKGPGADVQSSKRVIEVETAGTVADGFRQLSGYRRPVYIAGADAATTEAALEAAKGTTVGVMDHNGAIMKRSTRKRS
jgi:hypothetical protein